MSTEAPARVSPAGAPVEHDATPPGRARGRRRFTIVLASVLAVLLAATIAFAVTNVRQANASSGALLTLVSGSTKTPARPDRIVRTQLGSNRPAKTVYSAKWIGEFARLGNRLLVISDQGDGVRLRVVDAAGKSVALPGPANAGYGDLRVSPDGKRFGYLAMTRPAQGDSSDRYVLYLASASNLKPVQVGMRSGTPILWSLWTFLSGTDKIAAMDSSGITYIIDPAAKTAPMPYGQLGQLIGAVPGRAILVSQPALSPSTTTLKLILTDLGTGAKTTVAESNRLALTPGEALGPLTILGPSERVQVVYASTSVDGHTTTAPRAELIDGTSVRTLLKPGAGTQLTTACASPNGHDVAFVLLGTRANAAPTTVVIDARTGARVSTLAGDKPDWCAS
ncbi:hypothetical protein ACFOYW_04095 [Gryllotalpicola reticulitermitis]|uniref:WD40-like Beta Propeller Repeat n=1 Tax=Gryllotalpicola reticulitermitis TaxID=1184153 RepID=A0ABV8Q2E9_9MICO